MCEMSPTKVPSHSQYGNRKAFILHRWVGVDAWLKGPLTMDIVYFFFQLLFEYQGFVDIFRIILNNASPCFASFFFIYVFLNSFYKPYNKWPLFDTVFYSLFRVYIRICFHLYGIYSILNETLNRNNTLKPCLYLFVVT